MIPISSERVSLPEARSSGVSTCVGCLRVVGWVPRKSRAWMKPHRCMTGNSFLLVANAGAVTGPSGNEARAIRLLRIGCRLHSHQQPSPRSLARKRGSEYVFRPR